MGTAWAAMLILGSPALAANLEQCYALRDQRDAISAEAMKHEIALARTYRERICPVLSKQADGANAKDQTFTTLDYSALIQCRRHAEQDLERSHSVIYRNSQGFTFYTPAGALLARQADALRMAIGVRGCP